MKYYLIAGEASGDLHASYLMRAIRAQDASAEFRFWGGDLMAAVGGELRKHYRELAFMGFWEVLTNIRTILGNFKACKADILAWQADALILVDYPGFNLRMAKWARRQGLRIYYYISPQIWAWHSSRVHQIKANVDRMLVILPFEKDFYARYGMEVDFVGHPLLDVVADGEAEPTFRQQYDLDERPIIALLPGSRKQEIERMLSVMLAVSDGFPAYQFVVAGAPSQEVAYYQQLFNQYDKPQDVRLISGATYSLLREAEAALVTSGTATLETALFGVPQIVCYKGSPLSYAIAKRLINVKYISLVNLIMDQPLVLELIQGELRSARLRQELAHLLTPAEQQRLRSGYAELRQRLGEGGAPQRSAQLLVGDLRNNINSPMR